MTGCYRTDDVEVDAVVKTADPMYTQLKEVKQQMTQTLCECEIVCAQVDGKKGNEYE